MKTKEDVFGEAMAMLEAAGFDWQYDEWANEELDDGTEVLTWIVRIASDEMEHIADSELEQPPVKAA